MNRLDPDLHKQLAIHAAQHDVSLKKIVHSIWNKYNCSDILVIIEHQKELQ